MTYILQDTILMCSSQKCLDVYIPRKKNDRWHSITPFYLACVLTLLHFVIFHRNVVVDVLIIKHNVLQFTLLEEYYVRGGIKYVLSFL